MLCVEGSFSFGPTTVRQSLNESSHVHSVYFAALSLFFWSQTKKNKKTNRGLTNSREAQEKNKKNTIQQQRKTQQ